MSDRQPIDVSVVVVSFNARDALRECLRGLTAEDDGLAREVFVIDNASRDGSADMVAREFSDVRLLRSTENLGFAAANNRVLGHARGRYVVLLNPDAVLAPAALRRAVEKMDGDERVGLAGGRLVGPDGSWQPSARSFPSLLNEILCLTGLAARYPRSRLFGRADRTWADPLAAAEVDWVPGAFSIIRRSVLDQVGSFDERFFLYYEEVDLCRRIKRAGHSVQYWPDVVVVHRGGESARSLAGLDFSRNGSQLTAWRMRSAFLYHRKHDGLPAAWLAMATEAGWHALRALRRLRTEDREGSAKRDESRRQIALIRQAWRDTAGGRLSPARPW